MDLLAAQGLSGGCCVAAGVGFRLGLFESVSASDRSCDRGSLLHAGSLPSELRVEAPSGHIQISSLTEAGLGVD